MSQPIKLDGAALAKSREGQLKSIFDRSNDQFRRDYPESKVPILTIASLYNQDHLPSLKYSEMKRQAAGRIGINFQLVPYSQKASHDELADLIQTLATDDDIQGLMLQLPVPDQRNILQDDLIRLIPSRKDIDGLRPDSPYLPATVAGVQTLLDQLLLEKYNIDWLALPAAIIGSKGVVGCATLKMMSDRRVRQVSGIDLDTPAEERATILSQAGLVISTTGHEDQQDPAEIQEGAIWINVGLGRVSPELTDRTSYYTPSMGGVGPMTVQSLMENGYQAFKRSLSARD